jgi:hypothetical protein
MNARNLKLGVVGGLLGGAAFGAMMGMMGMLPMIGQMVGQPSALVGLAIHLANSAIIGAGFAVVFGRTVEGFGSGTTAGLVYGIAWWLLGPLTLMPLFMGMGLGVNWNLGAAQSMLPSLVGHIMYGVILGTSYTWLRQRSRQPAAVTAS